MSSLTDHRRQIVTESFARLLPISNEAATAFYNRLWEIAPETKSMFASADMEQQKLKLMQTLGLAVRSLHDPDSLIPMLRDLGKRHIDYGVTADQYELVRSALMSMIQHSLGSEFTPDLQDAWNAAYDLMKLHAVSAYE